MSIWPSPYLASTTVKREHYVPRRLLENFAVDGLLDVYEIRTGETFATHTINAAVGSRFYDLRVNGEDLSLEGWLADIEGLVCPILEMLIEDPSALTTLSVQEREYIARFVAVQELRSPGERWTQSKMRSQIVDQLKQVGQSWLRKELGEKGAEEVWEAWRDRPDEWFLNESEPHQPSALTAGMVDTTPGLGNVLQAMPWRIGRASGNSFYTSDSPVSKLPRSATRFTVYFDNVFLLPLAPNTLLRIGPGLTPDESRSDTVADFNPWETSLARHAVTQCATRHLFGPGPFVSRECAEQCLVKLGKTPMSKVTP
jgi:hypothetical protein